MIDKFLYEGMKLGPLLGDFLYITPSNETCRDERKNTFSDLGIHVVRNR